MLTAEQQVIRATGIGASEIAAVCGIHPFKRPIDIYALKVGVAEPQPDNDTTDWGNALEPLLAEWYTRKTGVALVKGETVRHPQYPWALCTPDFIHSDGSVIVECKNVGQFVAWHWSDDEVAEYVNLQCQWQMEICGIRAAKAIASIGGMAPQIFDVEFSPGRVEMMMQIAGHFWNENVLREVPPTVDSSDAYKEFLARRFPRDRAPIKRPENEAETLAAIAEYNRAKAAIKESEEAKELAANQLRAMVGDASGLIGDWGTVKWTANKAGTRTLRINLKEESKDNGNTRKQRQRSAIADI